jgi:hypothetical protein
LRSLKVRFFLLGSIALVSLYSDANSQAFLGLRAGANANKIAFDNEIYKKFYDTGFRFGYTGGVVFLYEAKEKYGLYTEFLYSQKGKYIESRANDYLTNVADYQYFDMPVLFRVRFKQPKFDWFLMLGPEFNYWLGGNGAFEVYDPGRDEITRYEYEINFGETSGSSDILNVEEANRLQISFSVGAGFVWKLQNANYVSFDMRFSLGNTYIGGYQNTSIPNIALVDNLEYTNNILSLSAVYYVDILEKLRLSKNKYRKK